jgi:regulator of sigma E protease
MIFEKIFTFILFLGPLVFFHELGHFFFARLFKVRVEVFSLGFGPKLLRYKWGETEYVVSLIPLGGYVKMFGDDPFNKDAIPEADQKFSYNHQSKWARFWIVLGGPLTNFILAFFIFYSLLLVGEKIPEIKLGSVDSKSVLYSYGLRSGDVLLKLDGNEIYNPSDLVTDGNSVHRKLEIKRLGNVISLDINLKGEAFFEEIIKHPPMLRRPFIVNQLGKTYGLSLSPKIVDLNLSIEELIDAKGTPEKLYAYLVKDNQDISTNDNLVFDFDKEIILDLKFTDAKSFAAELARNNFWTLDLMVKSMNFNSPAEKGGVKAGDIFFKINGINVASFEETCYRKQQPLKLVLRPGEMVN